MSPKQRLPKLIPRLKDQIGVSLRQVNAEGKGSTKEGNVDVYKKKAR